MSQYKDLVFLPRFFTKEMLSRTFYQFASYFHCAGVRPSNVYFILHPDVMTWRKEVWPASPPPFPDILDPALEVFGPWFMECCTFLDIKDYELAVNNIDRPDCGVIVFDELAFEQGFGEGMADRLRAIDGFISIDLHRQTDDALRLIGYIFNRYVDDAVKVSYLADSKVNFSKFLDRHRARGKEKVYIYASGESTDALGPLDLSDGSVILIGKGMFDHDLIDRINPLAYVLMDHAYLSHSTYGAFARKAMADFLEGNPDRVIICSGGQDIYLKGLLDPSFSTRIIGIPFASGATAATGRVDLVSLDLMETFELQFLGSVGPSMALPVAASMSRTIVLLGFDGQAKAHAHPEPDDDVIGAAYLSDLADCHPTYLFHLGYGYMMDKMLNRLTSAGWMVQSLTPSFIKSVQDVYLG